MRVKLTVSRGSNEGKSFDVNVPQFVIGRAKGCQLRPQSDAISRQHCVITVSDDKATIRDLGSRNGTIVNGEKIEGTHTFADGDELRVGPLHLAVVFAESADRTPAAETETITASSEETKTVKPTKKSAKESAADKAPSEPMPTQAMSSKKDSDSSDDIGSWLEEDDNTNNTKIGKATTRIFRLDESERVEVAAAAKEATEEEEQGELDLTAKQKTKKKKKEFGKLPEREEETTANSREAAEASLKKMFNRGL